VPSAGRSARSFSPTFKGLYLSSDWLVRLRALAEALPAGTVVPVPREWLLDLLEGGTAYTDPSPGPPPVDLTVADLAARFGRSPSTVRGWLERGMIAGAYRFQGREWRVPAASLVTFEADQRSPRTPRMISGTDHRRGTVDLSAWRRTS
jgi:hypothetical protein